MKKVIPADTASEIKTAAYGQSFKLKPSFKAELLKSIGEYPFNSIAGIINAADAPVVDEQTLNQIMSAVGQFPYIKVEQFIRTVNEHIEPIIEE